MKFLKSLFASTNSPASNSASFKSLIDGWPQIKIYYEILSEAFHKGEKGKLDSIKSNSGILVEKAEELSIEAMPADYRNPKTIETLHTLNTQTKLVNDLVKKEVDDAEIKLAFTKLHETFYSIVELCLSEK
ncbi:MAG TPA: hypothetical protein PKN96_05770 [Flavobacterium sp.]|uniref:hypothetical protein n=1 Tax=Flavobacterium sp. TaxID=239 RepID=UPI002C2171E4|nr:hypothetical protein [Flavobacterium sp.]HNP32782.1 hypothetical protein [Flavobacterium sp.]